MYTEIIILLLVIQLLIFTPSSFADTGDFITELVPPNEYAFRQPFAVAVDGNNRIIVSDISHPEKVLVFDESGNFVFAFDGSKSGIPFDHLVGVAADNSNNIVAADPGLDSVKVFDENGDFMFEFDSMDDSLDNPAAIAIDSNDRIIVTFNDSPPVVQIFNPEGVFIGSFDGTNGGTAFRQPYGVAVDSSDNIIVVDTSQKKVQVFNQDGKFMLGFDGSDNDGTPFGNPYGVAVDSMDKIFVVDAGKRNVQIYSSDGAYVDSFDGSDGEEFNFPTGIAIDSNDRIIVSDLGLASVQVFDGSPIVELDSEMSGTNIITEGLAKDKKNGGCADCIPPTLGINPFYKRVVDNGFSYNGNSVQVETRHTKFPLVTAQVGNINTVEIIVYENSGKSYLKMVQFGLGATEIGQPLNNLEVLIAVYIKASANTINDNDLHISKIIITDKDNLIDTDTVFAIVDDVKCMDDSYNEACVKVSLQYSYREATINNIMVVSVSDWSRNTQNFYFNDGVQVVGESLNPAPTYIMHNKRTSQQTEDLTLTLTRIDKVNHIWIDKYDIEYLQISEHRFENR